MHSWESGMDRPAYRTQPSTVRFGDWEKDPDFHTEGSALIRLYTKTQADAIIKDHGRAKFLDLVKGYKLHRMDDNHTKDSEGVVYDAWYDEDPVSPHYGSVLAKTTVDAGSTNPAQTKQLVERHRRLKKVNEGKDQIGVSTGFWITNNKRRPGEITLRPSETAFTDKPYDPDCRVLRYSEESRLNMSGATPTEPAAPAVPPAEAPQADPPAPPPGFKPRVKKDDKTGKILYPTLREPVKPKATVARLDAVSLKAMSADELLKREEIQQSWLDYNDEQKNYDALKGVIAGLDKFGADNEYVGEGLLTLATDTNMVPMLQWFSKIVEERDTVKEQLTKATPQQQALERAFVSTSNAMSSMIQDPSGNAMHRQAAQASLKTSFAELAQHYPEFAAAGGATPTIKPATIPVAPATAPGNPAVAPATPTAPPPVNQGVKHKLEFADLDQMAKNRQASISQFNAAIRQQQNQPFGGQPTMTDLFNSIPVSQEMRANSTTVPEDAMQQAKRAKVGPYSDWILADDKVAVPKELRPY